MKRLFVHMPKCAGASVLTLLGQLAPDRIETDYASYFRIPRADRAPVLLQSLLHPTPAPDDRIVYGHFFPLKYVGAERASDVALVTILRDPSARLQSHYRFWNEGDFSDHYLWRRMKSERWTFLDFAFSDEMRNFYAQYLCHVPLGAFSFIGVCENLAYSVRRCLEILDVPMPAGTPIPRVNAGDEQTACALPADVVARLRSFHAEDYVFYDYARLKFHAGVDGATK
jgi:hypothetical protein